MAKSKLSDNGLRLLGETHLRARTEIDWCRAVGTFEGRPGDFLELVRFVIDTQESDPCDEWEQVLEEAVCAAIEEDLPDVVKTILEEYGDTLDDQVKTNVMEQACLKTAPASLAVIIEKWPHLADPDCLRTISRSDYTAETAAACFEMMIRHGVRYDLPDADDGLTALAFAEQNASEEIFAAIEKVIFEYETPKKKKAGVKTPRRGP
jgi:hypothetical protein